MILDRADVLILDEPTRNFSPLSAPVVRELLFAFNGTIIAVSHDRAFIRDVADTVYVLDGGTFRRADLREILQEDRDASL